MLRERINPAAVLLRFALVGMVLGSGAWAANQGKDLQAPAPAKLTVPPICEPNKYAAEFERFSNIQPEDLCKSSKDNFCNLLKPADLDQTATDEKDQKSICLLIYNKTIKSVELYKKLLEEHCANVNARQTKCNADFAAIPAQIACLATTADFARDGEAKINGILNNIINRFNYFQNLADQARQKYDTDAKDLMETRRINKDPNAWVLSDGFTNRSFKCDPPLSSGRNILADLSSGRGFDYPKNLTGGLLVQEQTRAINGAIEFKKFLAGAAQLHEVTKTNFQTQGDQFRALAKRFDPTNGPPGPLGPPNKKPESTITGDTNKPPQIPQMPQQQQQGGGGGSPSGGGGGSPSGGGGAPTNGGGPGGDSYPNPKAGLDTAKAGGPNDGASKPDGGRAHTGDGGSTAKDPLANKGDPKFDKPGGISNRAGLGGLSLSGSELEGSKGAGRQTAGTGGSRPASASPSGGGGGGGGGGSGKADPNCEGPNCQALAPGATSSQFAGAGSLGGSPLSLGGLDSPAPLDNLFKTDDPKAGALPGADPALAGLGAGDLTAGGLGPDGNPLAGEGDAQGGTEIGARESKDLFVRVSGKLESAQKRGMVAGIFKKL